MVVLKYHFPRTEIRLPGEMPGFKSGAGESWVQVPQWASMGQLAGSSRRLRGSCQKDSGASLERLSLDPVSFKKDKKCNGFKSVKYQRCLKPWVHNAIKKIISRASVLGTTWPCTSPASLENSKNVLHHFSWKFIPKRGWVFALYRVGKQPWVAMALGIKTEWPPPK